VEEGREGQVVLVVLVMEEHGGREKLDSLDEVYKETGYSAAAASLCILGSWF